MMNSPFDQWYASRYYGHPWEPPKQALQEAWEAGAESRDPFSNQASGHDEVCPDPETLRAASIAMAHDVDRQIVSLAKLPAKAIEGHLMARAASSPIYSVNRLESDITPETIYAAYPRKVGKQAALKAIRKAIATKLKAVDRLSFDADNVATWLLNRTTAYAAAVATWPEEDKKFIPHPATWFNQGRYDDDPREWQRGKPAPKSQFISQH